MMYGSSKNQDERRLLIQKKRNTEQHRKLEAILIIAMLSLAGLLRPGVERTDLLQANKDTPVSFDFVMHRLKRDGVIYV